MYLPAGVSDPTDLTILFHNSDLDRQYPAFFIDLMGVMPEIFPIVGMDDAI